MKNISTGFGLCAIAAAVALYPVLDRFAPISKEAHAGVPVSAITSAALAQTAPTIVWYGVGAHGSSGTYSIPVLFRAWSDGKVEANEGYLWGPGSGEDCSWRQSGCFGWIVVSSPTQGLSAASDSNFDAQVDGADLSMLLGNWGNAPRHDITPSDCPLNLINP